MKAQLLIEGLRAVSAMLAFIRQLSDDDSVLQEIVDKAHKGGREVNAADVREAVTEMDASRARLESKLSGA